MGKILEVVSHILIALLMLMLVALLILVGVIHYQRSIPKEVPTFTVGVNYDCPIKDFQKNYDVFDKKISDENFPRSEGEKGTKDHTFKLFFFGPIESGEAIKKMAADDFRPATVRELLVFDNAYKEFRFKFPIIQLGSIYDPEGKSKVVFSEAIGQDRRLDVGNYHTSRWFHNARFLGIKK